MGPVDETAGRRGWSGYAAVTFCAGWSRVAAVFALGGRVVGRGEGRAHDGREGRSELGRRGECYGRVMGREGKDGAGCGFKRDGGRSGGGNGGEETVLGERTWGHWTSLEGRPGGARRRKRGVRFHLGGEGLRASVDVHPGGRALGRGRGWSQNTCSIEDRLVLVAAICGASSNWQDVIAPRPIHNKYHTTVHTINTNPFCRPTALQTVCSVSLPAPVALSPCPETSLTDERDPH